MESEIESFRRCKSVQASFLEGKHGVGVEACTMYGSGFSCWNC